MNDPCDETTVNSTSLLNESLQNYSNVNRIKNLQVILSRKQNFGAVGPVKIEAN
jgi:hypothetical protein